MSHDEGIRRLTHSRDRWKRRAFLFKAARDHERLRLEVAEERINQIRTVLNADLKTASDRVLTLELENQKLKAAVAEANKIKLQAEQRLVALGAALAVLTRRHKALWEALKVIHTAARGDEKSECWTIRRWLGEHDVYEGDISGSDRLIEMVCDQVLAGDGGTQ